MNLTPNEIVRDLTGALITVMFAKFAMNEVPHALGVLSWYGDAWNEANAFMVRNRPDDQSLDSALGEYEEEIWDWMQDKPRGREALQRNVVNIKKVIGGYYWIATELAPDDVVNEVYSILFPKRTKLRTRSDKILEIDEEFQTYHDTGSFVDYKLLEEGGHQTGMPFAILNFLDALSGGEVMEFMRRTSSTEVGKEEQARALKEYEGSRYGKMQ